jgi:hypothetical protein
MGGEIDARDFVIVERAVAGYRADHGYTFKLTMLQISTPHTPTEERACNLEHGAFR